MSESDDIGVEKEWYSLGKKPWNIGRICAGVALVLWATPAIVRLLGVTLPLWVDLFLGVVGSITAIVALTK